MVKGQPELSKPTSVLARPSHKAFPMRPEWQLAPGFCIPGLGIQLARTCHVQSGASNSPSVPCWPAPFVVCVDGVGEGIASLLAWTPGNSCATTASRWPSPGQTLGKQA